MRHLLANVALYVIALLLIGLSVAFAAIRSGQLVLSTEAERTARYEPADHLDRFEWEPLGARVYTANCRSCHRADGSGWDQYPGLGQQAAIFGAPGGRDYLIDVMLYGLASPRWRVPMPPLNNLGDAEIASVLNYMLTRWGNDEALADPPALYLPVEIGRRRGRGIRPGDVDQGRPSL